MNLRLIVGQRTRSDKPFHLPKLDCVGDVTTIEIVHEPLLADTAFLSRLEPDTFGIRGLDAVDFHLAHDFALRARRVDHNGIHFWPFEDTSTELVGFLTGQDPIHIFGLNRQHSFHRLLPR